jgi:hypothetical protein
MQLLRATFNLPQALRQLPPAACTGSQHWASSFLTPAAASSAQQPLSVLNLGSPQGARGVHHVLQDQGPPILSVTKSTQQAADSMLYPSGSIPSMEPGVRKPDQPAIAEPHQALLRRRPILHVVTDSDIIDPEGSDVDSAPAGGRSERAGYGY